MSPAQKQPRKQRETQSELSRPEKSRPQRAKKSPLKKPLGRKVRIWDHGMRLLSARLLRIAHNYVPVLWLPNGAMALAEGNAWLKRFSGRWEVLCLWRRLARSVRSTIRFYRGQEKGETANVPAPAAARGAARPNFLEKRVPFVSEEVGAMSLAFFRSMSRAPEIKMGLFTGVLILLGIMPFLLINPAKFTGETMRLFMGAGAVGLTFPGFRSQIMFNRLRL